MPKKSDRVLAKSQKVAAKATGMRKSVKSTKQAVADYRKEKAAGPSRNTRTVGDETAERMEKSAAKKTVKADKTMRKSDDLSVKASNLRAKGK